MAFDNHRDFLRHRMDPDFGLLDKLRGQGALSKEEIGEIKAQTTYRRRNSKVLDYITDSENNNKFLEGLRESKQSHIANYLTENGEYNPRFGLDWPLSEREISILDTNHESLIELIYPTDLVVELFSTEVINGRQKETILSKPTTHEKNEALIEILERRSLADYSKTIHCLRNSNQSHIAEILDKGGVVVRVNAEISGNFESTSTSAIEEELSTRISSLILGEIPETPVEQAERILRNAAVKIIAARTGRSVVLYVYCILLDDICHLAIMLKSGSMVRVIEELFICALPKLMSKKLKVKIRWNEEEIKRGIKLLKNSRHKNRSFTEEYNPVASDTVISHLPLELLDSILRKTYLYLTLNQSQSNHTRETNKDTIVCLASVGFSWFQTVTKGKFKRSTLHQFEVFHRKSTALRNNRCYLEQFLQPRHLIARLRSVDCLTDVQARKLKKTPKSPYRFSSPDLLIFVKSFDERKYCSFVRSLRQTSQATAARVIERGGVVVRVEINYRVDANITLIQRITEICNRNRPMSNDAETLIARLKEYELEILHSYLNGANVVVWIWCQSKYALDTLHTLYATNCLSNVLNGLATVSSVLEEGRQRIIKGASSVNIDYYQFRKELCSKQMSTSQRNWSSKRTK